MYGIKIVLYGLPLVIVGLCILTFMVILNSHFKNKDNGKDKQ